MGGLTLDAFAKFQADINGRLDGLQKGINATQTPRSELVSFAGNILGNVSQIICMSVPGPPGGKEWHIRRISFGTELDNIAGITTAGTLVFGKGSVSLLPTGQYVANTQNTFIEITRTTTVPNAITFSEAECVIRYGENLIFAWRNGVGQLIIDGDAEQMNSHAFVPASD